jgi:hypothetical protein
MINEKYTGSNEPNKPPPLAPTPVILQRAGLPKYTDWFLYFKGVVKVILPGILTMV